MVQFWKIVEIYNQYVFGLSASKSIVLKYSYTLWIQDNDSD